MSDMHEDPVMPFGQYKGVSLTLISEPYLWWTLREADQVDRHEGLADAIEEELTRRKEDA